ncbi:MAG: hypothetical protein AAF224_08280 [Pseudomonadota bacterium]
MVRPPVDVKSMPHDGRIALVGMSNIGKSRLTGGLSALLGGRGFGVDDLIQNALGLNDMAALSGWLGAPTADGYADREAEYLRLEEEGVLAAPVDEPGLVLDTTGSVAHTSTGARQFIHDHFTVVYLEPTAPIVEALIGQYLSVPKPVIWGGAFDAAAGEAFEVALKRCYPKLLAQRAEIYDAMADATLVVEDLGENGPTPDDVLAVCQSQRR